jgi:integrase
VMIDGRQVNRSTRTTDKAIAKRILKKIEAEISEGRFGLVRSISPRFDVWADQFLETVHHTNTKRAYKSCIVALKQFFGHARLSEVTASRIEEFKASRLKSGTGPATINGSLQILRRMLKIAERQRFIGQSPYVEFLNERSVRRQARILTFAEQDELIVHSSPLLRAFVFLITESGLRTHREGLSLLWQDVDFAEGVIRVRESKTIAGRRVVPMSELCKTELLRWRRLTGSASEYVFPNFRNKSAHLKSIRKPWTNALKKAHLDYFPIYCLRGCFATRLSCAGVPDVFVSQMMGHAGGLLQTYSKAITDYKRDAIHKLEEFRKSQRQNPPAWDAPLSPTIN